MMINKHDLSEKVFETLNCFDPFEVRNTDTTPAVLYRDIVNNPDIIISGLCDIINELLENI